MHQGITVGVDDSSRVAQWQSVPHVRGNPGFDPRSDHLFLFLQSRRDNSAPHPQLKVISTNVTLAYPANKAEGGMYIDSLTLDAVPFSLIDTLVMDRLPMMRRCAHKL